MIPTLLSLVSKGQIKSEFLMGPHHQRWMITDVDEANKKVLCHLVGTTDSVWLPDHIVYDLLEDYNDTMALVNAYHGCC